MWKRVATADKSKLSLIAFGIVAFVGVAWWVSSEALTTKSDEKFPTTANEIVARGRIEPLERVLAIHGAADGSIIRELKVAQGDKVAKDQVLAVLDGYAMRAADLAVAEQNLRLAELLRNQISAGAKDSEKAAQRNAVNAKEAQLTRLKLEWDRRTALVAQGFASKQSLESLKAELEQTQNEVEQARHTLRSLSETRGIDEKVAAGRVVVAKASVEKAQADLEHTLIRAPIAGTILSIQSRAGEAISQDGLLRMASMDHIVAVAEVDEAEAAKLKIGMAASIESTLLPKAVPAQVTRIAQEVFRQKRPSSDVLIGRDARIVEVDLTPQQALPAVLGAEVMVRIALNPTSRH